MRGVQERGIVEQAVTARQAAPVTDVRIGTRGLPVVAAIAVAVVILDQVTKTIALSLLADGPVDVFWTLRLRVSLNPGMAFSLGTGLTPLVTIAGVLLVGALIVFARSASSWKVVAALGLLIGGASGNLGDRLFRDHGGAVVDFIDFQWWPVFNVADIAISFGAVGLVIASVIDDRRIRRSGGVDDEGEGDSPPSGCPDA